MDRAPVSAPLSSQDLLASLKDSGLLSVEQLERAASAASGTAGDGGSLASVLVADGVLTAYQMDAVCRGTSAELRLGNYDVLDRLGAGGMGAVFKARHRRMKRVVALKVLAP